MGNEGGRTGCTQASASASPCVQKTTIPIMPCSSRPFLKPAHWSRAWACGREGRERGKTWALWLEEVGAFVRLLRPRLAEGAWSSDFFFFLELEKASHWRSRGEHCSCARVYVRRELRCSVLVPACPSPALAPGSAAGSLEPAGSSLCAALAPRSLRTECGLCGSFSLLPKFLKQWTVRGAGIKGGELGSDLHWGIMTSAAGKWRRSSCRWKVCSERCRFGARSCFLPRDRLVVFPLPFSGTAASAEQTVFAAGFSRPFVPKRGSLEIMCLLGPPFKGRPCWGLLAPGETGNVKRAFIFLS